MDDQEVADRVIDRFRQYIRQGIDSYSQEPYREEMFRIFIKAHNENLRLTADHLIDLIIARWPDKEFDEKVRKNLLERYFISWSEWKYAWDNIHLKSQ